VKKTGDTIIIRRTKPPLVLRRKRNALNQR